MSKRTTANLTPVNTGKVQTGAQPFRPGHSGNPKGRPKGSRNKLGEDFLSALQADFSEHGPATIAKVREERPHEYLKVVASILPKELTVKTNPLEELTDEELEASIQELLKVVRAGASADPETKHRTAGSYRAITEAMEGVAPVRRRRRSSPPP